MLAVVLGCSAKAVLSAPEHRIGRWIERCDTDLPLGRVPANRAEQQRLDRDRRPAHRVSRARFVQAASCDPTQHSVVEAVFDIESATIRAQRGVGITLAY